MSAADPRPCRGENVNVCVAEGCYGQACLLPAVLHERIKELAAEVERLRESQIAYGEAKHRQGLVLQERAEKAEAAIRRVRDTIAVLDEFGDIKRGAALDLLAALDGAP